MRTNNVACRDALVFLLHEKAKYAHGRSKSGDLKPAVRALYKGMREAYEDAAREVKELPLIDAEIEKPIDPGPHGI
jgi:hypothetical protein